jgi:hypothetical protein
MRKAMLLSAAITLCAAMALAQDTPSAGASSQAGSATSNAAQTNTDQNMSGNSIQGCLTGTTGNYMLTDATGATYKVQGDESQLSANLNKQVEVTGTVGSSASASATNNPDSNAPNSSASGQPNQGGNPNASGAGGSSTGATATATATKTLDVTSVKAVGDSCSNNK